jgi:hypothetical protein
MGESTCQPNLDSRYPLTLRTYNGVDEAFIPIASMNGIVKYELNNKIDSTAQPRPVEWRHVPDLPEIHTFIISQHNNSQYFV